jgi:hypothetical protein
MTNPTDHDPVAEINSPACAMHEADDAYMGYAELIEKDDQLVLAATDVAGRAP